MNNIKDAPDFALISEDKTKVYLVEVKYQSKLDIYYIKMYAEKLSKRWSPSWLFVASPEGFFCDPCHNILNKGQISKFSAGWVTTERQKEYMALLKEFEK